MFPSLNPKKIVGPAVVVAAVVVVVLVVVAVAAATNPVFAFWQLASTRLTSQ